jgi:hypothetical protein
MYKCTYYPKMHPFPIICILKWVRFHFQWATWCNKLPHLKGLLIPLANKNALEELFRGYHYNGMWLLHPPELSRLLFVEQSFRIICCLLLFQHHNVPFSLVILKKLENAALSSDCFQNQILVNAITSWTRLYDSKK